MPRGHDRRIFVSKSGPLYVDGVPTKKGNVPQATKRVVSTTNRLLAHSSQPGPIITGFAQDLLVGEDVTTSCTWCGIGARGHDQVIIERETGRWWHGVEQGMSRQPHPPTCRRKWVKAQGA